MDDMSNRAPPMDEAKARTNREKMSISNLAPPVHRRHDHVKPAQPTDGLSYSTATGEPHRIESRYIQPCPSTSELEMNSPSYVTMGDRQRRDSGYVSSHQSMLEQPRYSPSYQSIMEQPTYSPSYPTTSDDQDKSPAYARSHRSIQARPTFSTQDAATVERQIGVLEPNPFLQPTRPTSPPWHGEVVMYGRRPDVSDRRQSISSHTLSSRADRQIQPYPPYFQGETPICPIIASSIVNPPRSGQRKQRKKPEKPRGPQPAYSDEQRFYLMFARITLDLTWPEIMAEFSRLWGPRTRGGLTAMYYRTRDGWGMPEVLRAGEQGWNNDQQAIDARAPNFSTAFLKLIGYLK